MPTATPAALMLGVLLLPNSLLGCAISSTPTRHRGTQIQISLQCILNKDDRQHSKANSTMLLALCWVHKKSPKSCVLLLEIEADAQTVV